MLSNIDRLERYAERTRHTQLFTNSTNIPYRRAFQSVEADLSRVAEMKFMRRLLKKDDTADTLTRHNSRIISLLHLFSVESALDISAHIEIDRRARYEDTLKLDALLVSAASSERRLTDLISVGTKGTRAELGEIKDLLHLACRQIQACAPGRPERKFYEATFRKMNALSGGRVPRAPGWVVSPLEIDRDEGKAS